MTNEIDDSELESAKQDLDKARKAAIGAILELIYAQNPAARGMGLNKEAEQAVDSIVELIDQYVGYNILMSGHDLDKADETDDFSIN
jgi:hypothetical protein